MTGVNIAVKLAGLAALTDDGPATVSVKVLVRVMATAALSVGSATLTAASETPGGAIRICGAVYTPEESTVPHAPPEHAPPEINQVTARSGWPAEFNVAVKVREAPNSTGMASGMTETEMSLVIVTCAVEILELSAALVACTDTETGTGRFAGAV